MEDYENSKRSKRFKSAVVDVMDQKEFDARLVKFVVKTGVAFRLIEDDSFRDLFNQKCNKFTVMCTQTLSNRLTVATSSHEIKLKEFFKSELDYVCTTFDIWTHMNHSYMGATWHGIDKNLKRRSFILHCDEFDDSHNFANIGERILAVHNKFDIPLYKITSTITDNAANFVKCFKEMGIKG